MAEIDFDALRERLSGPLLLLAHYTHTELDKKFTWLGVTEPPPAADEAGRSKAKRVEAVVRTIPDADLGRVASVVLASDLVDADVRNAIQDVMWVGQGPVIETRTRREIAADLDLDAMVIDADRFDRMLDRLWVLGTKPLFGDLFGDRTASQYGLRGEISRHVYRNRGDWTAEHLFDVLGAFESTNRRFALFLEALVSHEVVIKESNQRALVEVINPHLRKARLELRETSTDGGYPVFRVTRVGVAPPPRPKNLIFASTKKPDLRLRNAIDNDIEILDNGAEVLVYDEPIGAQGLRWRDLQAWWSRANPDQPSEIAKSALYQRLLRSLPPNSPPQDLLFRLYHEIHRARMPDMPAMLPEVWLHWDPKTVQQRGAAALLGLRMDFLLLLPGHRIILEVDGVTHYTDAKGRPSPAAYASNAASDRERKLRGYEVFRFGGAELQTSDQARPMLTAFFSCLFDRFGTEV